MKLFKQKKKELNPEQSDKIARYGEKVADKLKLGEKIVKFNDFGNKNPKRAFTYIFGLIFGCWALNLICAPFITDYSMKEAPMIKSDIKQKENLLQKEISQEMKSLYDETEFLVDTLSILLAKESLTREDSLYLAQKMARLEAIDKVMNEDLNPNQ